MAKTGNSSSRNQRNNPYLIEGMMVDFHPARQASPGGGAPN